MKKTKPQIKKINTVKAVNNEDMFFSKNIQNDENLINLYKKITDSQMLYNLASLNWNKLLKEICLENRFELTSSFSLSLGEELKNFFINKLEKIIYLDKEKTTNLKDLSEEDLQVIKILINQIKSKKEKHLYDYNSQEKEHTEENKLENTVQVKEVIEKNPVNKNIKKLTFSKNPYIKPFPSHEENQARAILEAQNALGAARNIGVGSFSVQSAPSEEINGESSSFRDPNAF